VAAASGGIAQATSDFVPYALLAGTCLITLIVVWPGRSRLARRLTRDPAEQQPASGVALARPPRPGA